MTISDEDLKNWEERCRQITLPDIVRRAVNRLRTHEEEKEVQLEVPSSDYYVARGIDFSDAMGWAHMQLLVDREIYVVFRKNSECFHS
jgi:hypothetical protein